MKKKIKKKNRRMVKKKSKQLPIHLYYCYAILVQPVGSGVEIGSFSKYWYS